MILWVQATQQADTTIKAVSERARIHVLLWWNKDGQAHHYKWEMSFKAAIDTMYKKGIISHVSYFVYNIVNVGSGTCKQTFLPYAQNINCPRPRDIWYTFTLVDTTVFWNKNVKRTIKKVERLIKRSQTNERSKKSIKNWSKECRPKVRQLSAINFEWTSHNNNGYLIIIMCTIFLNN